MSVIWYHSKTQEGYTIVDFGLQEGTLEPVVIYRKLGEKGPTWVRPCTQFFDGRFVQQQDK